jgi:hypothetical protein
MNRGLLVAGLLVRKELEKTATVAEVASGIGRAIKGTGRVIQRAASAAGREVAGDIGGTSGKVLGGGIAALPGVAAGGTALYGINEATGNPMGRYVDAKKQQLAQRLQASQAYANQGVYY